MKIWSFNNLAEHAKFLIDSALLLIRPVFLLNYSPMTVTALVAVITLSRLSSIAGTSRQVANKQD